VLENDVTVVFNCKHVEWPTPDCCKVIYEKGIAKKISLEFNFGITLCEVVRNCVLFTDSLQISYVL